MATAGDQDVGPRPRAGGRVADAGNGRRALNVVADRVRWAVRQQLAAHQSCVCDRQEQIPIASNLLSYHLKALRDAGRETTAHRGRWIDRSPADDALNRPAAALPGSGSRHRPGGAA